VQGIPDVVRALQRHVGNRAVTAMLARSGRGALQRKQPGPTAPQQIPPDHMAHPEWPQFRQALAKTKKLTASEIESVWHQLMYGITAKTTVGRAFAFADAAERLRDLLRITPGRPLALWSGGFDVSKYAEGRRFSTLEHTVAGRLFQELELYKDWGIIGEFWDQLSRVFVQAAQGEVHVFMRTHDPMSTLLTREVKTLRQIPGVTIRWHALFGEALGDIREIDFADDDLVRVDGASFDDETKAHIALKNFIVKRLQASDEPNTAADAMHLR
jgi:hypothetical protein